jgi:hypothetical protein
LNQHADAGRGSIVVELSDQLILLWEEMINSIKVVLPIRE